MMPSCKAAAAVRQVQARVRQQVLRACVRRGLLDQSAAAEMGGWDHGGGFSLDAAVRIEGSDRAGLERLLRYCGAPRRRFLVWTRPFLAVSRVGAAQNRPCQLPHLRILGLARLKFLSFTARAFDPVRGLRQGRHSTTLQRSALRSKFKMYMQSARLRHG